jgi:hypothetical protein
MTELVRLFAGQVVYKRYAEVVNGQKTGRVVIVLEQGHRKIIVDGATYRAATRTVRIHSRGAKRRTG